MVDEMKEEEITREGNPAHPEGKAGAMMLERMNASHYALTGWALSFWQIKEDDVILDVGCGGGMTLHRMADEVKTGRLVGVDYSETSVEESKATNTSDIASGKMRIELASVDHFPFEDEMFDKIITVESFYFWPDAVRDLKEVHRVLKKDGVFLLTADIYDKPGLSEEVKENIRMYGLRNPDPDAFRRYFEEAGFSECIIHTKDGTDWICVEGHK
jgi:SAM-dependent methyltransferase